MPCILAVDDSPSIRQMIRHTLESVSYEVTVASDGQEALDAARQHRFDLILTDQNMPHLDGLGLTRQLRQLPSYRNTPILILTTESSPDMKQAGRSAGATGWIVKPFNPAQLVEVIGRLVN